MNFFAFVVLGLLGVSLFLAAASAVSSDSDVMTVEANILSSEDDPEDIVRISVPDRIFLGNVSVGGKSTEMTVEVNNTGTVDVTVTPRLVDISEDIFSYLYFRDQKTRTVNGTVIDLPYYRIGDFSFDISKPASGSNSRSNDIYMTLDLRNYTGTVGSDIIGYSTDVKFVAVAK